MEHTADVIDLRERPTRRRKLRPVASKDGDEHRVPAGVP